MKKLLATALIVSLLPLASAATNVIEDFEVDEGLFDRQPTFSGSTSGILLSSTADRVETMAYEGIGSQELVLLDDPAVSDGWFVRHLYNGGSGPQDIVDTGWIGFWLKTDAPGLTVSIALDNPGTADRGIFREVVNDGEWHLYQWGLEFDSYWNGWVTGDGMIVGLSGIDSIQIDSSLDQDATIYLDYVAHNTDGFLPEPGSLSLLALGGLALLRRR
jgi:hypothetical protein